MIAVDLARGGRVRARYETALPVDRSTAWVTLADFERIVCLDHFHQAAALDGRPPVPGLPFRLPHRVLGLRVERHGRILRWEEGWGYAFSDLAVSPHREVFAHVFRLRLAEDDERGEGCRLVLEVHGRWALSWLPRWATRAWLAWNLQSMGRRVANAILADALRADCSEAPAAGPREAPAAGSRAGG